MYSISGSTSIAVETNQKGTAVDSVNANIESLTNRVETLTRFAHRVVDGIIGPTGEASTGGALGSAPRPVAMSTQDHLRALENAFERLSTHINRLG